MKNGHRVEVVASGPQAGGTADTPARYLLCCLLMAACSAGESQQRGHQDAALPTDLDNASSSPGILDNGQVRPGRNDATASNALPDGGEPVARPSLCDRSGDDRVRDVFCGDSRPVIGSLAELQRLLALDPDEHEQTTSVPGEHQTAYVLVGHSTALSGHLISPINPRAILLGKEVVMAFQRGVQQVELATHERSTGQRRFYLVTFEQACNGRAGGCLPGDLYTPTLEVGWQQLVLQDDEDLKNTRLDCRQCHQRALDEPVLLMRELRSPWTHFFAPVVDGTLEDGMPGVTGADLVRDYRLARGDEPLAGLSVEAISNTLGIVLELFVEKDQPLVFDAPMIFQERWPWGPGFPEEPQRSPTWDAAYAAFKRGEQLPLPHFKMRPTDADKQAYLTEAYRDYREGRLPAAELPDLADIFPDDPWQRAEIGLQTEPEATPAQALIQACGSCHNDVLDQSLSRARFNIAIDRLARSELDLAIARLSQDPSEPGVMPPPEARQLPRAARDVLIDYLRRESYPPEDLELLRAAAEHGMAGGQSPTTGFVL